MYLITRENKKTGYVFLDTLLREEGISREYKKQIRQMLQGHKVMIGNILIEKIFVNERI
jgi:hypothetical protein